MAFRSTRDRRGARRLDRGRRADDRRRHPPVRGWRSSSAGSRSSRGGPRHAGFEATGELRRKDFGIDLALPPGVSAVALGDVVKIELDVQLLEPAAS